jgi:AraC family transcriptional regulator, arabinose operon regulatory protein
MSDNKKLLIRNYLSNLKIDLLSAEYTHCWREWQDIDYIPSYNKLYFIYEGEGWLKIGKKEFYPKPNQMFLMPAGVKQSYSTINDNTFTKFWCHFTAKVGEANLFDVLRLSCYIDVPDAGKLQALFKDLIFYHESTEIISSLKVKAILLDIICYYLENTAIDNIALTPSPNTDKIAIVTNYINNNLSEQLTVDELSRLVHFHPNYFIRFFKNNLGVSPINYINKIRMEKAKELVKTSNMQLKEIAAVTGFNDLFYFSKTFKSYTGFSPSEYRQL